MRDQGIINVAYETIKKYNMLEPGDKVIVGVSGGPDSLCLLYLLNILKSRLNVDLYVAHVNHGIRGTSADEDEKFVVYISKQLKLPVFVKHAKVYEYSIKTGMTVEEAGREVRYTFFKQLMGKLGANKVAVGHNMNDNAETVVLNLLRGSGMEGLKGIEPVRDFIIRPLIGIKRQDIENYCRELNINPRMDESNTDTAFTRNRVRVELIPYLKENFNPNVIDSISRTAQLINDENSFLSVLVKDYYSRCLIENEAGKIILSQKEFCKYHNAVKRRVLRMAVEGLKGTTKGVERIHIDSAIDLITQGRTGTWIRIPKDVVVSIEYNQIVVKNETIRKQVIYSYKILIPGDTIISKLGTVLTTKVLSRYEAASIKKSSHICVLDHEKIQGDILIRNRRNGDVINPSGMLGTKKLKDFFIDEKIPREARDSMPLVAVDNEIIWIIGRRYSDKYEVSNQTREVLVLEYKSRE